ncbi:MAG: hypothetical protein JXO72_12410 [Vicinamibacteria bacterium]|nr:hypothetical protein [Vicinamibacteria bacterium]
MPYLKKPVEPQRHDAGAADDNGAHHAFGDVPRGHASASNPPAPVPDRRLVDILSSAIAEHEQEMITHGEIERLRFFRRTLGRLSAMLAPATSIFHRHPEARGRLQSIIDAASALRALFTERCPFFANAADGASQDRIENEGEAAPSLAQRLADDPADESATLDMELEGVLFEVAGMRDVLSRDHALATLFRMETGSICEAVRQELRGINVALAALLQTLTESIGLPSSPAAQPAATMRTPHIPVAPQTARPPASAPPWASQTTPPPSTPVASEATGLALSMSDENLSNSSSVAYRSEEEGIKALQAFFESNSPEGVLLKTSEGEFADLVGRLLHYICPEIAFSQNDMTIRLRQLKDTLALRKKLHNNLTLAEFKAYFRKTR